jgi:flagellar biosynthesis protein FlhF
MFLNRFRGDTVQAALRAAREALGADALVLSTRTVPAAGWRGLIGARVTELTAAAQRPPLSSDRHPKAPSPSEARAESELVARLEATGLERSLARHVTGSLPRGRRRGVSSLGLRTSLETELASLVAPAAAPGVDAFIGPPGAGKTTTIAKIAALARARGGARLGLIAADGFRVGAVDQLRLYADIIGAPLAVARTPLELERALDAAKRPLLVDTAGRSPNDDASRDMWRVLAGRAGVRLHLVLPASTSPWMATRIFDRFSDSGAMTLALTRMDEAGTIGPLVSVIRDRGYRVAYLGTGQNVPDDLDVATPASLAAWVAGDPQHGAVA